ncbi:Nipsnap, partial [Halocaridina rubra]
MLSARYFVLNPKRFLQRNPVPVSCHLSIVGNRFQQQLRTSSTNQEQKVYELRIYTVKPNRFREYLDLTKEEFHLRTAHSKLLGYWVSEIGGLNQVVHIWEYDSLTHRATVRANLANDSVWISRYLSRVVDMFDTMTNSALTLLPNTEIALPTYKGVYELQTMSLRGAPSAWSNSLVSYVKACNSIDIGPTKLVGSWQSLLGPKQMVALLWFHPSPDSCVTLKHVIDSL